MKFPVRINRYLALHGIATRREADGLIKKHLVTINERIAIPGEKVRENDVVNVKKTKQSIAPFIYIAYHKPAGIITHSSYPAMRGGQRGALSLQEEKDIAGMNGFQNKKLFPVGRLDKESCGLMILTNDGRITDRLLNPTYDHEKEYIVETDKKITPHVLRLLRQGVVIEGYRTKPSLAAPLGDRTFRIILSEGKKHQIRRMLAALGLQVRSLKRVRIMNITLGNMKQGEMREITGKELNKFLKVLGLNN